MTATAAEHDVAGAFKAALAADAGANPDGAPPAPPRRERTVDPEAPHGREESGEPKAPYGVKADGTPRLKPAGPGRPKTSPDDKPRTAKALPPATTAKAEASSRPDYTEALSDLADGFWMLLSGAPVPARKLKTRVQAQAAILAANKASLVKAGNIAAQNHEGTAQLVEKLTTGNAAWMLPCMFALIPFVGQSVAMWRAPVAGDVELLAAHNEAEFKLIMDAALAQAAQEAAEAA